jgi:hypothetical protein
LGWLQDVEDAIAIFLDEQFETVAEDGSLEEVSLILRLLRLSLLFQAIK